MYLQIGSMPELAAHSQNSGLLPPENERTLGGTSWPVNYLLAPATRPRLREDHSSKLVDIGYGGQSEPVHPMRESTSIAPACDAAASTERSCATRGSSRTARSRARSRAAESQSLDCQWPNVTADQYLFSRIMPHHAANLEVRAS